MSRDLEHIILIPPTLTCLRQDLQACCDMKSVCVCVVGEGEGLYVCLSRNTGVYEPPRFTIGRECLSSIYITSVAAPQRKGLFMPTW